MLASTVWRSRPIFITSTFRDMHAERDWLRVHVFPVLEERLRERFHHLETIDLRWGVESASAEQETDRERLVLTVCLREIERSRPFLIGLLGDRYGWRPPAGRLLEAAGEAGFDDDLEGRSVTELEILYGVLRDPDQARRSWFYFREPLPYAAMPRQVAARYSDAFSDEPDASGTAARLAALKTRVIDALPGRVRTYTATWDAATQAVTGLEAWGAQVIEDLWSDLEAETSEFRRQAPRTWQEQDRWALDEFVEGRARGFVGRTGITDELLELAASPAAEGAAWGACVTAEAGAGKSSLFGHLQQLLREREVLVLSHAAGISVRSTQVDWTLRRWVGEVAAALGEADPLDDTAPPDDIDETFRRLLGRVAAQRRVVVLIDALNQFEPTTRATHLTWLPRLWPPNARLVATAIPAAASTALLQRPGVVDAPLSPIDRDEALDIVRGICARYHRTLNPVVEARVLDKRREGGAPAYGNPLWLELAAETLNLLGGDVFDRVDLAAGAGGVVRLLVQEVDRMPADVAGLYGWMLDGAERHFGEAWTRAFVEAIVASRSGWRESDLKALMPALSGEAWDPLRFATLRRGLRAHVVQRGAHAQWDFAHAQMRQAAEHRATHHRRDLSAVHDAIGHHLLALRRDDAVHESETLVHLMRGTDPGQAARHYGGELTVGEARGATAALASMLAAGQTAEVVALLERDADPVVRGRTGERFLFELTDAVQHAAPLEVQALLGRSASAAFQALAAADPRNARWQRDLSVSHIRLGGVLKAQGLLPGALAAFQTSHAIAERLAVADPGNAVWQSDLSVSHGRLGDVLKAQGHLLGALAAFQTSHAIAERLAVADPGNAVWQSDLSVSHNRLGEVLRAQENLPRALGAFQASREIRERLAAMDPGNAAWQLDLAGSHDRVGEVLTAQGNLPGALAAVQASLATVERLTAADPGNRLWQHNLSVSQERLGDVLRAQGALPGALAAFQASRTIRERLAAVDPGNANWQYSLSRSHNDVGHVLWAQGNFAESLAAFQASRAIASRLAAIDPDEVGRQHDLAVSHERVGEVLRAQANLAESLAAFEASRAIFERLAAMDPSNARWQSQLAVSHERLGNVLAAQGNLLGALMAVQTSHGIRERLAAMDPGNVNLQYHLSVSHENVGNVLIGQGHIQGALAAFQACRAIAERLVAADPGNAKWQGALSASHIKMGEVQTAQGNLPEAVMAFQASHAIAEQLAATDSGNTGWQRDLAVSFNRLATQYAQVDDVRAAEYWRRCYEVLARMHDGGMHLDQPANQLLAALESARNNGFRGLIGQLGTPASNRSPAEVGVALHDEALEFHAQGAVAEALTTMQRAIATLASAVDGHPAGEAPGHADVLCNLASAQTFVGDWTDNVDALCDAIATADLGLAVFSAAGSPPAFTCAALWHNRGHAGWRLAELTGDRSALLRGIADLEKAHELFMTLGRASAVTESAAFMAKAKARLEGA